MKNIFLKVLVFTLACFSLSWIIAAASGLNHENYYPKSVFHGYKPAPSPLKSVSLRRSFADQNVDELVLKTTSVDIDVEPSDGNAVEVAVEGTLPNGEESFTTESSGRALTVSVRQAEVHFGFWDFDGGSSSGKLTLHVPKRIQRIEVHTVSGDTTIHKIHLNRLETHSVSGNVNLAECEVQEQNARSVSGNLRITESSVQKLKGKTTSGDFSLSLTNADPEIDLRTVSGQAHYRLHPNSNLAASLSSVSGDLSVDSSFPHESEGRRGARFGQGKGHVSMHSTSGDLRFEN